MTMSAQMLRGLFGDGNTFVDATGNFLLNATANTPGALPAFYLRGHRRSQAPDFNAFFGAQYSVPSNLCKFTFRAEVAWRDRVYFTPFNVRYVSQAPNAKLNAFINWTANDYHWTGSLFVKNLINKTVVGNSLASSAVVGFPLNGYLEDPRTYGLTLGYKF
jgi:iron complex outermembrane recepter protein